MNEAKFASITAALLVRKGEAAPSVVATSLPPVPVYEIKAAPRPRPRAVPVRRKPIAPDEGKRRVVVTLTGQEFQRLGIIAAKKNSTRHDLVRDALFEQLNVFAREQAADCRCINGNEPCGCDFAAEPASLETPSILST
jgi:hypothetical protein